MKPIKFYNLITLFIVLSTISGAQSNHLSNSKVYEFLDRMEVKGYININHHQKPFTRQVILEKLKFLAEA
ncbi:MAG: hypothetical protein L6Q47_17020, partial [Ignavibacteriaceae bacterium]|nr:hypothetical protein [Ignavibacteriaceae bacterium]